MAWWSGDLARFQAGKESWLQVRDARLGVLIALLAGYLPWARRVLAEESAQPLSPAERARSRHVALSFLLLVPVIALLVDRDPLLYLDRAYWRWTSLFNWIIGGFLCWHIGALGAELWLKAKQLRSAALEVPIDALDMGGLAPVTSFSVTAALLIGLFVSVFAINFSDPGFLPVVVPVALIVSLALSIVWRPLATAHERIRAVKHAELARVTSALRGGSEDAGKLAIRAIDSEAPSVQELLAYRRYLTELPEWPFDFGNRFRLLFYLSLPVGSWVGGALVERALSSWLA